jgi:hypothetical protein
VVIFDHGAGSKHCLLQFTINNTGAIPLARFCLIRL